MIRTYTIENGQKPTEEQLREVEEAKNHPIIFDEDCRELSTVIRMIRRDYPAEEIAFIVPSSSVDDIEAVRREIVGME